ncbi:RND family efflux transporter, MFP subunit [Tranquillimonas rosea]|uniref:RND family efflux transporter, MFP subunit n=1 Tax=Tranquillimonas rosea TaxID=641238 RepID=A0A1H9VSU8_9RHOB|nr:efflux RND transporter periplasmic adaptor subunit [Tranquillimonas rosea]SES24735.1 RND family efflux transporter, MFP subunit [Tranquillimonas rosea]
MSLLRQALLGLLILAGTLALWVAYVPSASAVLERAGILDLIGIDPVEAQDQAGRGYGGGVPQVVTGEVETRALGDRVVSIGDARALRSVTVRAETVGQITEIPVEAGRHVDEGAVLARLDDEAEVIAVERARLVLADARDDLDRLQQLERTGAVTSVSLREAELAVRTAELEVRQAEFDLDRRVFEAPISGWLGLIDVEVGDRISAQDVFATITDRTSILIDFRVPERVVDRLSPGMEVTAQPLGISGGPREGRIHAIDTVVDRASRTLRVQAELPNDEDRLRSGMAFEVVLTFPGEPMPAIDPLALQWSADGSYVWRVDEGAVQQVPVVVRQRNADAVLVEADLAPGDRVVTEGVQTLRPGAEVEIVTPGAGADA